MQLLVRLDLFLWNHFMPNVNAGFFRNKLNAALVVVYISFFYLPRKFLLNYFRGNGKTMVINTREAITSNRKAINRLIDELQSDRSEDKDVGTVDICQTDVYHPNYKYSIGSFRINYQRNGEAVNITIQSIYRFQESSKRVTKHLHNLLFTLKNNGKANEFSVQGKCWQTNLQELRLLKEKSQNQKSPNFKLLV